MNEQHAFKGMRSQPTHTAGDHMKSALCVVFVAVATALMGCGSSQQVTSVWKNPKPSPNRPYKSIFIMAITQNAAARNTLEADLAAAVEERGFRAVRSLDALPGTFTKPAPTSREEMLAKLREVNCDAVFTLSLLDVKSEQRYVPGTTTYAAAYAPYPQYNYYGNFYGYYSMMYPTATTPGYYTEDKTYFLEGNLYDAATEEIQFSMQSRAWNPNSLSSFSRGYVRLLLDQLNPKQ
jgi:hypothetical protein